MRHLGLYLVLVACANNVPQDRSTGPDGRQKGAREVALEDGAGRASGIVTYPGGDRVDWKKIVLPDGKHGDLDLKLTWRTPRPGLQVAFDVFDQWNKRIVKKASASRHGRLRSTTIPGAKGTYWVRVFAPQRGDAGEYELEASFKEEAPLPPVTILNPPRLPAVPPPEQTCDVFNPRIPACASTCPDFGAPPGWKACAERDKADKEREAREQAMKDYAELLKNWPKPVTAKILNVSVESDGARITLGVGTTSQAKLDTSWTGEVLGASTGSPLAGGTVKILSVGKTQVQAKVKLKLDILNKNGDVKLSPPPPPPPPR